MKKAVTKISVALAMCRPLNANADKHTHYVCEVNDCNSTLSGSKSSNVVAHMEARHADIFKQRLLKASEKKPESKEMEIRRLQLIQSMTESVTRNGRPLALLYDSGYRKIIQKEVDELTNAGYGTGFSGGENKCPPVVLDQIRYLSSEVINAVKLETEALLLSLMLDIGSRNGRDILGISIQYMHDRRIVIRSLGMIIFEESHTALNIINKVMACLALFDIKPNRIVSITSDNASNMLATVKTFNRAVEDKNDTNECDDNENDCSNEEVYQFDIPLEEIESIVNEYHATKSMTDEDIEIENRKAEALEILDESAHFMDLLRELQNDFILHTLNTYGVKCAAHTLQLAVKRALCSTKIRILINACRAICKLLRKIKYKNPMRERGLDPVTPPLDCKVRWNSTFIMIEYIVKHCKETVEHFAPSEPIFEIVNSNWTVLIEVVSILRTVYDATMDIQNQNFTLSDFFCAWIRIQVRLQRIQSDPEKLTDLSDLLLESMQLRKNALLDHPAMLCAIFLDPRVHRELDHAVDSTKFKIAKLSLANLNDRIVNLPKHSKTDQKGEDDNSIDEYFRQSIDLHNDTEQKRRAEFLESLDHFHHCMMGSKMKIEKGKSLFDFWEENKLLFPTLYDVACVVNSIPASQATVERAFSALKFVFGEQRGSLTQERLEDILMIKLNGDLAESIDRRDIINIQKKCKRPE